MNRVSTLNITGVNVSNITSASLLEFIGQSIANSDKNIIAYANADTINKASRDKNLLKIFNSFPLIHPDGIGVYLASKILYKDNGLSERVTGSDFYSMLIRESVRKNWRYFFFGHNEMILEEVKVHNPDLNIAGTNEGYRFNTDAVIKKINSVNPDILIIGLSCPVQEQWIFRNQDRINFKTALIVGDGIKVFAGKKVRGPVFMRKIGLEWVVRYLSNPVLNFKKYILGVPEFIIGVIRFIRSKSKT